MFKTGARVRAVGQGGVKVEGERGRIRWGSEGSCVGLALVMSQAPFPPEDPFPSVANGAVMEEL